MYINVMTYNINQYHVKSTIIIIISLSPSRPALVTMHVILTWGAFGNLTPKSDDQVSRTGTHNKGKIVLPLNVHTKSNCMLYVLAQTVLSIV